MTAKIFITLILVVSLAQPVAADDTKPLTTSESTEPIAGTKDNKSTTENESDGTRIAFGVLYIEACFLGFSYLTSLNPKTAGTTFAILSPLASAAIDGSSTTRWVVFGASEALAIYNITLDKDKMSKSEIFKANVIGWHAWAATFATTMYFTGDLDRHKKVSLNYVPEPHGGLLMLSYRF